MKTLLSAKAVSLILESSGLSLVLLLLVFLSVPSHAARRNSTADVIGISLPSFSIGPQETIVGIEYALHGAIVVGVGEIRSCWDVHIYNGDELRSKLQAEPLFLSAGIRKSDLSYLANFVSIRENEPEPAAHTFDVTVKLTVTDARWDKIRYVTFSKDQLILSQQR